MSDRDELDEISGELAAALRRIVGYLRLRGVHPTRAVLHDICMRSIAELGIEYREQARPATVVAFKPPGK